MTRHPHATAGVRARDLAGLRALHDQGLTGAGVRVGHLDSGVDASHAQLGERIEAYRRFDDDGEALVGSQPRDATGHGTATACIAAGGRVGDELLGIAPRARLLVGEVLEGGQSIVRVLAGLDWLAGERVDCAVLCAGLPELNPVFAPMLAQLRSEGVLVVCPIGNAGAGRARAPGDDVSVLSVGAVDARGNPARFSGSTFAHPSGACLKPDVLALGVDVRLADARQSESGTSVAAAVVVGVAALLFESSPGAGAERVQRALELSATSPSSACRRAARCGVVVPIAAAETLRTMGDREKGVTPLASPRAQRYVDPRLAARIQRAAVGELLTGVFIVAGDGTMSWDAAVDLVLRDAIGRSESEPTRVRRIARGAALIVTGSPRLLAALTQSSRVEISSAPDASCFLPTG